MKLLSATILGVSLVIGGFLMKPPRYEHFPAEVAGNVNLNIQGTLDTRTGEVCLHAIYTDPADAPERLGSPSFTRCSSR